MPPLQGLDVFLKHAAINMLKKHRSKQTQSDSKAILRQTRFLTKIRRS